MATPQTYQAPAYTAKGTARDRVALPPSVFDGTIHMPAMHQAVKAYLANQRQGTAATKIRKYVTGGNQKPWRQKGTGRARQGSIRAPHWVGGGTVFGPTPRSYAQYVPRQVRALARKSAFNARARENAIVVIDVFDFETPRTKLLKALVDRVGGADKKVLVLTHGTKPAVFLSGRNLENVHVMPYADVSTYHLLWSDLVIIEEPALAGPAPLAATSPAPPAPPAPPAARPRAGASADRGTTGSAGKRSRATRAASGAKRGGKKRS